MLKNHVSFAVVSNRISRGGNSNMMIDILQVHL